MLIAFKRALPIVSGRSNSSRNSGVSNCWFAIALISASMASMLATIAVIPPPRLVAACSADCSPPWRTAPSPMRGAVACEAKLLVRQHDRDEQLLEPSRIFDEALAQQV